MSHITTETNQQFDYIPWRIHFIKNLLDGKKVDTMVEFDHCDTEAAKTCAKEKDVRKILDKKKLNFNRVINQIGGKLLYKKSGTTGHVFQGLNPYDRENGISYAVKVIAYPKKENYGDIYDAKRPENAELLMLKVLSYFVVNNQTPHIVLPIGTFYTSIKPFVNLKKDNIVNNKKYDKFLTRYNNKEFYDTVSILISEWANGGDLLDYIRSNYKEMGTKEWRVLCFQLLSVLTIIQTKYPTFRHNDLKANNLLVHYIKTRNRNNRFKYEINGKIYIVPNIGFQIKMWDFDFATIPGLVDNAKVETKWTDRINVKPEQNRYYDMHYFFNTLTKKGFFSNYNDPGAVPTEVKNFINRVVPKKFQSGKLVDTRGRLLVNEEYITPEEVLRTDIFFNKLRPSKDRVKV